MESSEIKNVLFIDIQLLNMKWKSFMKSVKCYYNRKIIPVLDVSIENYDDAFYCGFGFSLLLAMTGSRRILILSHKPIWIILNDTYENFYDSFCKVWDSFEGVRTHCDWYGGQQLLLDSLNHSYILENNIDVRFLLFSSVWRPLTSMSWTPLSSSDICKNSMSGIHNDVVDYNSVNYIPIMYWNTGSDHNILNYDCSQIDSIFTILMSGESIELFSAFLHSFDLENNGAKSSFDIVSSLLGASQYQCLGDYFSMFCYRLD